MTEKQPAPYTDMLAGFYKRLGGMEAVIRIVLSEAEVSALLTFRGEPERRVLLDYTHYPARIMVDGNERHASVFVTIPGGVMHDVLTRRMAPGRALGQREMLLRGSAADLARFIQLLEFGPVLYLEHLADINFDGYARSPKNATEQEADMTQFHGDPIPLVKLNPVEKIFFGLVNGLAWFMGFSVGFIRYRIFKKLSLFDVLGRMSAGLDAARPQSALPGESE